MLPKWLLRTAAGVSIAAGLVMWRDLRDYRHLERELAACNRQLTALEAMGQFYGVELADPELSVLDPR